jgi:hypothetical protein
VQLRLSYTRASRKHPVLPSSENYLPRSACISNLEEHHRSVSVYPGEALLPLSKQTT